jgi:hypothetical protein
MEAHILQPNHDHTLHQQAMLAECGQKQFSNLEHQANQQNEPDSLHMHMSVQHQAQPATQIQPVS